MKGSIWRSKHRKQSEIFKITHVYPNNAISGIIIAIAKPGRSFGVSYNQEMTCDYLYANYDRSNQKMFNKMKQEVLKRIQDV
jgi:hypothetical protein